MNTEKVVRLPTRSSTGWDADGYRKSEERRMSDIEKLRAENRELRSLVDKMNEHIEYIEDSLDAHIARYEQDKSGQPTMSIQDLANELGL